MPTVGPGAVTAICNNLLTSVDKCQQFSGETSEACAWPRMSRSQRAEARATTVPTVPNLLSTRNSM